MNLECCDPTLPLHDPRASALAAGLRYVSDSTPGIRRRRAGRGFRYLDPDGALVRDEATLARIRALAVPPAWREVWICPFEHGHIQAVGRDLRHRKQYRYHPRWVELRDAVKYDQMIDFGRSLPAIRAQVHAAMGLRGLPREKVLATLAHLLERTLVRVGNEEYARANESFGLTTLREQHVEVDGGRVRFQFRGKSGVEHAVDFTDRRVARIIERMVELPGEELFQYLDEAGERHVVHSTDVNAWLREVSGRDVGAKDFRTWAGTVLMVRALANLDEPSSPTHAKRQLNVALSAVAGMLRNTRAVCRKCYVHPAVTGAYLDGSLLPALRVPVEPVEWLHADEVATLRLLTESPRPLAVSGPT